MRLYPPLAESAGTRLIEYVSEDEEVPLTTVLEEALIRFPGLDRCRFDGLQGAKMAAIILIGNRVAARGETVRDGDVVQLLPPYCGG